MWCKLPGVTQSFLNFLLWRSEDSLETWAIIQNSPSIDFATFLSRSPLRPYRITALAETLTVHSSLYHSLLTSPFPTYHTTLELFDTSCVIATLYSSLCILYSGVTVKFVAFCVVWYFLYRACTWLASCYCVSIACCIKHYSKKKITAPKEKN